MYSSNLITLVICLLSLYIVIRLGRVLILIRNGSLRSNFFALNRSSISSGAGHLGVSLLCRDTDCLLRLETLLSVEYPHYEVVVVADSLRNRDSLQRIISRYRMIWVDNRSPAEVKSPYVRKMYRSASKCYRRLILLDVATAGKNEDLNAALNVATYDYILPLEADEMPFRGSIERLIIEISLTNGNAERPISCDVGTPLTLYPRAILLDNGGFASAILHSRHRTHIIHERLACGGIFHARQGSVAGVLLGVLVVVGVTTTMFGIAPAASAIATLTATAILSSAYWAHALTNHHAEESVGYGEILYLFCKKLLPEIWQIRK